MKVNNVIVSNEPNVENIPSYDDVKTYVSDPFYFDSS